MKNFKIILMILVFFSIKGLAVENNNSTTTGTLTGSEFEPTTDDKVNPELLNTLPAVNILNLSGKDCDGNPIQRFIISTLPDENAGILYLENAETVVTLGQYLSIEEANGLRFDPNENFEGNASFTYASVDGSDRVDASPATVTLAIVAPVVSGETNTHVDEECEDYETSIPSLSNLGLLLMNMLILLMGTFFMKRETSL